MIVVRNLQRKIKVDVDKLKADAQIILDTLDYSDFDLAIMLVNNKTMHAYNKEYRQQDKPTDVLSFPYHPNLKPGQRITIKEPDDRNLGDIIIAPEYVMHDLPKWKTTFEKHMQRLLVHGICHLLGYDHIKDADFKIMRKKELFLLKKLQKNIH
jgi:probable rRNA maturation factor